MIVAPHDFTKAMDRHWTTTLGNVSSPLLRMTWDTMARTFNNQIANHGTERGRRWKVLDPATGTGKTQGLAVYCSMLPEKDEDHPGVLVVTRLKEQAEDLAGTVNTLAGREVAKAYHSGSKDDPRSLAFVPLVVICHRAFEIGLDAINRGQPEQSNYEQFIAWAHGGRKLVVIDESLNVIEEAQVSLEQCSYILGVIPHEVQRQFPENVEAIRQTGAVLRQFADAVAEAQEQGIKTKDTPTWLGRTDLPDLTDLTDLRRELRSIRFDRIVLHNEDDHARRKLAKRYDNILRCIQATIEQWHWFSREFSKGNTLNTARLIVPEDAPGVVILDATAKQNIVYSLLADKVDLVPVPSGARSYSNATLWTSRGHRVGKRFLSNKKQVRDNAAKLVRELEENFGPDRKVLVVCHLQVEAHIKLLETHFEEFHVAHWGALDGRNEWKDCDVAVIFGLPYMPTTWSPNVYMAIKGVQKPEWFTDASERRFGNVPDVRRALNESQLVVDVVQALNRIRTRKVIDERGNCDLADLVVYLPDNTEGETIRKGIHHDMPGLTERTFEATVVKRRVRKSNHEAALVSYAQAMRPGRKSASNIKADLGIQPRTWERLTVKLKDTTSEVATAMAGVGVQYVVEGVGRGARSYLAKA